MVAMSLNAKVRTFCMLQPLWMLLALPVSAGNSRIYITNSAGDTVDVIDSSTNKVVQVIKGIEVPHGVNFSPDGKWVYITNESAEELEIVDQKTGAIANKVHLSGHPNNIAVTKDGHYVLICIASAPGALDIVDPAAVKLVKTIPTKGGLHNVYITPDQKYAVAGSVREKRMTVFDLQSQTVAWDMTFDGGVRPMTIEKNPDGSTSRVFVQLSDLHGFAVVDFAKHKEVARVKLPDGPYGKAEWRTGTPSHGIGIAPDGKTLWINSILANAIFEYSLPDLKLIGHTALPEVKNQSGVKSGAVPEWITFTPDSRTVYVSNSADRSVSAIDTETLKQVARITVGEVPKRINTLTLP
jgi:YVTN family beta-propeller protein